MTKPDDDLDAVREIAAKLEPFQDSDRERILRWVRERLGMGSQTSTITFPAAQPSGGPVQPGVPPGQGTQPSTQTDIKTFVQSKNPKSDRQFAAAVAYFHRFVAPEAERKEHINAEDLVARIPTLAQILLVQRRVRGP